MVKLYLKNYFVSKQYMVDTLAVLIILLIGWNISFGIESIVDVGLADETAYLHQGLIMSKTKMPDVNWAPFYSVWYHFLSYFRGDSLELYYFNYKLMTILPSLALFITLRCVGTSSLISCLLASVFIMSTANIPVLPKVSHFALLFILSMCSLVCIVRDNNIKWIIAMVGFLMASYIRPEFFVGFIISVIVICTKYRFIFKLRYRILILLSAIIFSVLIIISFSLPIINNGGGRSLCAFGQHFSLNWVRWEHNKYFDPMRDYELILAKVFGNVNSVKECVFRNPLAILRHIFSNMIVFPKLLAKEILLPERMLMGDNIRYSRLLGFYWLSIVGTFMVLRSSGYSFRFVFKNWCKNKDNILIILVVIFVGLIDCFLIYPRMHYLLLVFPPFLILLLVLTNAHKLMHIKYDMFCILCAGFIFLLSTPMQLADNDVPVLKTIQFIRSLNITKPVNMMANGFITTYFEANYTTASWITRTSPSIDFISDKNINAILVDRKVMANTQFDTKSWKSFINNSYSNYFKRIYIPKTGKYLFLSKELLKK